MILLGSAIVLTLLIAGIFVASLSPEWVQGETTAASETIATSTDKPLAVLATPEATVPVEAVRTEALVDTRVAAAPAQPPASTPAPATPAQAIPLARLVSQELAAARQKTVATAQAGIRGVVEGNTYRLHTVFLPDYLAFFDRKLEELKAYNLYALDWVSNLWTGQRQDRSAPSLIADFETPFLSDVVAPERTRQTLAAIGHAAAADYASDVTNRLGLLKQTGFYAAEDWKNLPPLVFTDRQGQKITTPLSEVTPANGTFLTALGGAIEQPLLIRFERSYQTLDTTSLTWLSGESIFAIGQNATIYYGTFIVYWIGLFLLLRSQIIPINVFGALLGWLIWETISWGSWLSYEWWQYEHTRNALEPLIVDFAEDYFAKLMAIGADLSQAGSFRSLHQIEASFIRP
ncbi:MAG: hypothetical protein KJ904_06875 [Alphaproteobacteria bacterium]|nr:hypothetical protein [Alphaproteobacteria bacterium]MBU0797361.1 hypothetical protein [Alphaproteobacteria bacterium]MBU0886871.1 hypothetical protein [Alphaproteobacteria bacterium]MBU1812386.1 hypothetical protein [Alphaproteobacteria bacterium]